MARKNVSGLKLYNLLRRETYAANKLLKKPIPTQRLDKIIRDKLFKEYQSRPLTKIKKTDLRASITKTLKTATRPPTNLVIYSKLLSLAVEINKNAPHYQWLPISQVRKLVSEVIYPSFKRGPKRFDVKKARKLIAEEFKKLEREICDLTLLPEDIYQAITFYDIDNFLGYSLPKCVWVEVNGGPYGRTNIFTTAEYNYYGDGVASITNNINKAISGRELDSDTVPYYRGTIQVRPGKKNDGSPENYYLSLLLYIDDDPSDEIEEEIQIPNRIKSKAARRKLQKKAKKFITTSGKKAKSKSKPIKKRVINRIVQAKQEAATLKKLVKQGFVTKEQLKKYTNSFIAKEEKNLKNALRQKRITERQYKARLAQIKSTFKK